ncbi:MAG: hypothetical protein UIL37_03400 [Clostridia bacterium]|nr:hypothetical protein [Clostridia bacterium]
MKISSEEFAKKIINILNENGYEAFFVGGCVRDRLLDKEIHDYDIATSAPPQRVMEVLFPIKTHSTAIKHGTITAVQEENTAEITTYRLEGNYTDNRHPESLVFTDKLSLDLARRDFTINAMAYHPNTGIVDPFGGKYDLKRGILRCVGNPYERFGEDSLRIMRALRFLASLGFTAEKNTKEAIFAQKHLLNNISRERIKSELKRIICSSYPDSVLKEYEEVILCALKIEGTGKIYTGLSGIPVEEAMRFALLLHKTKNPLEIMRGLKCEKKLTEECLSLIEDISFYPQNKTHMAQYLINHGSAHARKVLALKLVLGGKSADVFGSFLKELEENSPFFSLNDLDIKALDLTENFSVRSRELGAVLHYLLLQAASGNVRNTKSHLLKAAESYIKENLRS